MRILITRPLEDGEAVAARLADMGHQGLVAPLLATHFADGPEVDLAGVQAVLATSANGIRALARRTPRRDLPVFAVGPQTAGEARALGFAAVKSADGDARTLAKAAADWARPEAGVLLHVCGEEAPGHLAEALREAGFDVRRLALYRMEPTRALPLDIRTALQEKTLDGALFFSPRSAGIFRDLTADLSMEGVAAFCISRATADALAPRSFARVAIAAAPNQDALLALLDN